MPGEHGFDNWKVQITRFRKNTEIAKSRKPFSCIVLYTGYIAMLSVKYLIFIFKINWNDSANFVYIRRVLMHTAGVHFVLKALRTEKYSKTVNFVFLIPIIHVILGNLEPTIQKYLYYNS